MLRLDVTEENGGGAQPHGAGGAEAGGEFAGDVGIAHEQRLGPEQDGIRRENQLARLEAALDLRGAMNLQRVGVELAEELALEDGFTRDGVGVEQAACLLQDDPALGAEVFRERVGDVVILQIHMSAATLAHGGLRRGRNLQFHTALEADDSLHAAPQFRRGGGAGRLSRAGYFLKNTRTCAGQLRSGCGRGGTSRLIQAEVLAALLANSGVGRRGFALGVPATRARHRSFLRLHRWLGMGAGASCASRGQPRLNGAG